MGCDALPQGIFPTQGSNPGLPNCRQTLYHLSHQGSPYVEVLLLLLSRFSPVQLCATPEMAAHQALCPLDSPDKNTGVGCHFLLQCRKVKSESECRSVMPDSLGPHGLYSPMEFASQNTGVDSLSLLQGIFPTQGSNPGLLHCRWIFYHLSHLGSLK